MMVVSPCFRQIFQAIADSCSMPRRPLMVRAALQRRSCDGVAATELRRPAPSRSFCASRGADAYATELMLRAALHCDGAATELRRSRCCDGVAAATELRRPAPSRSFCASRGADAHATELMLRAALHCDGAATESLLRRSCCCDGVAAATELRRQAPSRSFCASRLDATL